MLNSSVLRACCLSSLVLASLLVPTTSSLADAPTGLADPAAALVSAQYAQLSDAFEKRDVDRIMSYFTDDFSEVTTSGATVDRDQERKEYVSQLRRIKSMTCHFDMEAFTTCPAGAYCDIKIHTDGIGIKRIMFMKFQGAFTNDLIVHDLWIDTPTGWKLKTRLTLLDQTKIIGQ